MNKEMELTICKLGHHSAIDFAAEELKKYLIRMADGVALIHIIHRERYVPEMQGLLWVGLDESMMVTDKKDEISDAMDDLIHIMVNKGYGVISGVNPRSVLLAVYRFLTEAGCRWIRPGADGEYIPLKRLEDIHVELEEKPSYRHRCICIEGAVSGKNVLDMIDWAPKAGLNGYFIQFREAFTFFDRWYNHKHNPYKEPEGLSLEQARDHVRNAVSEIKKRGLLYHAVGHGWTCEPLGLPGLGWDKGDYRLTPRQIPLVAEVNGKREVYQGIPLNMNLCYSNPEARHLIINNIVEYLQEHSEVDILHFWLGDSVNSQCECAACQEMIPTDFYVKMLNDLDERLSQKGIGTKIVFLLYFDLLWAPQSEKIRNPDRFILMFAPITRTYSKAYLAEGEIKEPPIYMRNQCKLPSSVEDNLAFLKVWQKLFTGDSFDFDYHFMWDHCCDPGYYSIAKILVQDIKGLKKIGLNGYVSCQAQRVFMPTGLGMVAMGRALWDDGVDFDDIAEDYFNSAFGSDGKLCRAYLEKLSRLFDPSYLRKEKPEVSRESAGNFAEIPLVIQEFRDIILKNISLEERCHSVSWKYLYFHADLCTLLAKILQSLAEGNRVAARSTWDELKVYMQSREDEVQGVFDVYNYIDTIGGRGILKG